MEWGVAVACAYEAGAITTGKAPTITMLCGRYRWLAPAVIAALAIHLYRQPPVPGPAGDCPMCPVAF